MAKKVPGDRIVYVSSGGRVYHRDKTCPALKKGQDKVEQRGGALGIVETMLESRAVRLNRDPCRTCARTSDRSS